MSDIDNGGPAFPCAFGVKDNGMTMRDYFAAKALNGLLADVPRGTSFGVDHADTNMNYALASYAIADAMLEARKQ